MYTKRNFSIWAPLLAGALLAVSSCSQTELDDTTPQPESGKQITLSATHNQAETRMSHDDNGSTIAQYWTDGTGGSTVDAFKLYRGGKGEVFTISSNVGAAGATSAEFTGAEPTGSGNYEALYPAHRAAEYRNEAVMSLLGQHQTGNTGISHLSDYNFMTGWADMAGTTPISDLNAPIHFRNEVAILRITVPAVSGYKLHNLTMNVEEREEIAVIKPLDGSASTKAKNLSMTFDKTTINSDVTAYLTVFASSLTTGNKLSFSAIFKDEDGTATLHQVSALVTIGAGQSIEAGKVYNVNGLAMNTVNTGSTEFYTDIPEALDFGGGDGSENTPYLISTAEQLQLYKVRMSDDAYKSLHYKLTTDIHVTAGAWTPINISEPSGGGFDGGGHTISGALIAQDGMTNFGFFGKVSRPSANPYIRNLHVAADIEAGDKAIEYLGGIAGSLGECYLTNCIVSGVISATNAPKIGGVVGYGYAGKLENCVFQGSFIVLYNNNNELFSIGGIASYVSGGAEVSQCTNKTSIDLQNITAEAIDCGGITAGAFDSPISNCINEGDLSFTDCTADYFICCGGIVGEADTGIITNSRNSGTISGEANSTQMGVFAGGLAGIPFDNLAIKTSFNSGDVTVKDAVEGDYVGGLAGFNDDAKVYNCNTNTGKATRNSVVQGLIGGGTVTTLDPCLDH